MITSKIKLGGLIEEGILASINDKEKHVKILMEVGAKQNIERYYLQASIPTQESESHPHRIHTMRVK